MKANNLDPRTYYDHIVRIDHNLSDKQRVYGRISINKRTDGPYRKYWDNVASGNNWVGDTRQFAFDDVYTLSPTMVLNLRYGYSLYWGSHPADNLGFDPAQLGFAGNTLNQLTAVTKMFPTVSMTSFQTLANEGSDVLNSDIHSIFASINKQSGAHSMKFGTDIRSYRNNINTYGRPGGNFTFNTTYTQGPLDNSAASPSGLGQALASLMLGQPAGGAIDRNDNQAINSTYWSAYFHDNWRVTSRLTLDLGLRWEYEGPLTERFNRSVAGFNADASQNIEAAAKAAYAAAPDGALPVSQFKVRGGLLFAGVGGQSRLLWQRRMGLFAPRAGFAYQLAKNLTLRGGVGFFPIQLGVPMKNWSIQTGFNQATSLVPTLDSGLTFTGTLATPFPNGITKAPGASLGAATYLGQSISFYNPNTQQPYSMRWNMNTQTVLPGQILLEVGYVGSKTIKTMIGRNINGISNQYLSKSPFRDQTTIDYLSANIKNPFAGLIPSTGLNSANVGRSQLLLPYPQFGSITMNDYQGYTWYHSMQVRLDRRFRKGFTVITAYTYSKTMEATQYLNAADPAPYRVISSIDRPHNLAVSGIYEMPFGTGKYFLGGANRAVNAFVGGWQLNGVWEFTSGQPLDFGNVLFVGDASKLALSSNERTIDRWFNVDAGFEKTSAKQLGSNLRTFPLRFSGLRAGTYNVWNVSVLKKTRIRERFMAEMRMEALNALNHSTGWAPPNLSPTSSAFGRVTAQYAFPRIVQIGFKLIF